MPADISKCSGEGCPLNDTCYRYTMEGSMMQRHIVPAYDDKKEKCLMYWEDENE